MYHQILRKKQKTFAVPEDPKTFLQLLKQTFGFLHYFKTVF